MEDELFDEWFNVMNVMNEYDNWMNGWINEWMNMIWMNNWMDVMWMCCESMKKFDD